MQSTHCFHCCELLQAWQPASARHLNSMLTFVAWHSMYHFQIVGVTALRTRQAGHATGICWGQPQPSHRLSRSALHCTQMQPPCHAPQHTCRCLSNLHKQGRSRPVQSLQHQRDRLHHLELPRAALLVRMAAAHARPAQMPASKNLSLNLWRLRARALHSKHRRRASQLPQLGHILLQQRIQPPALRRHCLPQVCLHAKLE